MGVRSSTCTASLTSEGQAVKGPPGGGGASLTHVIKFSINRQPGGGHTGLVCHLVPGDTVKCSQLCLPGPPSPSQ